MTAIGEDADAVARVVRDRVGREQVVHRPAAVDKYAGPAIAADDVAVGGGRPADCVAAGAAGAAGGESDARASIGGDRVTGDKVVRYPVPKNLTPVPSVVGDHVTGAVVAPAIVLLLGAACMPPMKSTPSPVLSEIVLAANRLLTIPLP